MVRDTRHIDAGDLRIRVTAEGFEEFEEEAEECDEEEESDDEESEGGEDEEAALLTSLQVVPYQFAQCEMRVLCNALMLVQSRVGNSCAVGVVLLRTNRSSIAA